jgi:hypothetical protein
MDPVGTSHLNTSTKLTITSDHKEGVVVTPVKGLKIPHDRRRGKNIEIALGMMDGTSGSVGMQTFQIFNYKDTALHKAVYIFIYFLCHVAEYRYSFL